MFMFLKVCAFFVVLYRLFYAEFMSNKVIGLSLKSDKHLRPGSTIERLYRNSINAFQRPCRPLLYEHVTAPYKSS